jgi:hypothetical protein
VPRAGACVGARLKTDALYDPDDLRVDGGGDSESEGGGREEGGDDGDGLHVHGRCW